MKEIERMRFHWIKDGKEGSFVVNAHNLNDCIRIGKEEIKKAGAEVDDYYSILKKGGNNMKKGELKQIREIFELQQKEGKPSISLNKPSFEELLATAEKAQQLEEEKIQSKEQELELDQTDVVWKAFDVSYDTPGANRSTTVLVNREENVEYALAAKDPNFKVDSRWSQVHRKKEIPLSSVKVSELSLTDLIGILKSVK